MNNEIQDHPETLLPFYVNDSLSPEQRAQVDQHVQDCDHCRDEIRFLTALRRQVKQTTTTASPGELGLRRLMRDVKREQSRRVVSRWWKPAMAAAIMVIVLQSALLFQQQHTQPTYIPLGGAESGLQITFQPTATEAQIRELLNQAHARIIDGPGALGVYRIQLLNQQLTPQQREAIIAQLRQQAIVQDVSSPDVSP